MQAIMNPHDLRPGQVVSFIYNAKPRRVKVEKVAVSKGNYDYIVGADLTDGAQIKSFTWAKLQSPCEVIVE